MKKTILFIAGLLLSAQLVKADIVPAGKAKDFAIGYYNKKARMAAQDMNLAYTQKDANGTPVYYVFEADNAEGFVIISAEDAGMPVIGYSDESKFTLPEPKSNIGIWLSKRGEEIAEIRNRHLLPSAEIALTWQGKIQPNLTKKTMAGALPPSVPALVQTKWNQSPYYNAMCPGGSVTGCVATAMAQIMRFWSYPAQGQGSSSYTQGYNPNNYPVQSANYGATTYNWANMPLTLNHNNSDVALLNYHCGVSVEMDYDPSGSGAWVCAFDNPVCAQNAYVQYFRYDPNSIQGVNRADYSDDNDWIALLENDLSIGRPIQYAGWESGPDGGGHTWVCDGYDVNNNFHMNWGWGGAYNGFYNINNLNPGYVFSEGHEAVLGIQPIPSGALDAGIPALSNITAYSCNTSLNPVISFKNYGSDTLKNCSINYQVDNNSVQTYNWTGYLFPNGQTTISLPSVAVFPGTHTLSCYSSNPNAGADQNNANDRSSQVFTIYASNNGTLPLVEGFETINVPNTQWIVVSPSGGNSWTQNTSVGSSGNNSMEVISNGNTAGAITQLLSPGFDFSNLYGNSGANTFTFKLAYRQATSASADKLQVLLSRDCGATWTSRWFRSGANLATTAMGSGNFVPQLTDWAVQTVNVLPFVNDNNVMIKFIFTADASTPANNLYIDDINITNSVNGIKNMTLAANLKVYPNPATDMISIEGSGMEANSVIEIYNMLGGKVISQTSQNGLSHVDISSLAKGVYELKIITQSGAAYQSKIIKQ